MKPVGDTLGARESGTQALAGAVAIGTSEFHIVDPGAMVDHFDTDGHDLLTGFIAYDALTSACILHYIAHDLGNGGGQSRLICEPKSHFACQLASARAGCDHVMWLVDGDAYLTRDLTHPLINRSDCPDALWPGAYSIGAARVRDPEP